MNYDNSSQAAADQIKNASLYDLINLSLSSMITTNTGKNQQPLLDQPESGDSSHKNNSKDNGSQLNMIDFIQDAIKKNSINMDRQNEDKQNETIKSLKSNLFSLQQHFEENERRTPELNRTQEPASNIFDQDNRQKERNEKQKRGNEYYRQQDKLSVGNQKYQEIAQNYQNDIQQKISKSASVKQINSQIHTTYQFQVKNFENENIDDKLQDRSTMSQPNGNKSKKKENLSIKNQNYSSRKSVGRSNGQQAEQQSLTPKSMKVNKKQVNPTMSTLIYTPTKEQTEKLSYQYVKKFNFNIYVVLKRFAKRLKIEIKKQNQQDIRKDKFHFIKVFSQDEERTPRERSRSTGRGGVAAESQLKRVRSSKSNIRLGSNTSINYELIKDKVKNGRKEINNDTIQTPSSKGINDSDDYIAAESAKLLLKKKSSSKKTRGQTGNGRTGKASTQSSNSKPLFKNQISDYQQTQQKQDYNSKEQNYYQLNTKNLTTLQNQRSEPLQNINSQKYNKSPIQTEQNIRKNEMPYEQQSIQSSSVKSDSIQQKAITLRNQQVMNKISKQPTKKQFLNSSLQQINIGVIQEFERIKKPQKQALLIGKMFCVLLCTFRNPPLSPNYSFDMVQKEFDKWENIQYFIFSNPNRTLNECQMIKTRATQRDLVNKEYVQQMSKQIADNDTLLKNVPNKNLKLIFDVVQRALVYAQFKHMKKGKSPRKNSGNNKDLQVVDDSQSTNSQNMAQTEEADDEDEDVNIEEDNEDQFAHDQSILNQKNDIYCNLKDQKALKELNQFYPSNGKKSFTYEQELSPAFVRDPFINDRSPSPQLVKLTSDKSPKSSNGYSPSNTQKLHKLRQNYAKPQQLQQNQSPSNFKKQQEVVQQSPTKHNFTQKISSPKSISPNKMKAKEVHVNLNSNNDTVDYEESDHDNQYERSPLQNPISISSNQQHLQFKIDLQTDKNSINGSLIQSQNNYQNKSFIDKKASEILQEMINMKDNINNSQKGTFVEQKIELMEEIIFPQKQTNSSMLMQRSYHEVIQEDDDEETPMQQNLEIIQQYSPQSQMHSRKSSIKIVKSKNNHQMIQSDSEMSPRSERSNRLAIGSPSIKNISPKKKKSGKVLSPTQKLIKFKNKTHKTKVNKSKGYGQKTTIIHEELDKQNIVMQIDSRKKDQLEGISLSRRSAHDDKDREAASPYYQYRMPQQRQQQQYSYQQASQYKQPTESSQNSSQKNLDEVSYQIQMPQRDIFTLDDNANDTQREISQGNSTSSKIQVYNQETDFNPLESSDGFSFKLMRVEDSNTYYQNQMDQLSRSTLPQSIEQTSSNKRGIDMSTIEELKRRRLQQMKDRESQPTGLQQQNLSDKRDDIIKKIQAEIIGQHQNYQ